MATSDDIRDTAKSIQKLTNTIGSATRTLSEFIDKLRPILGYSVEKDLDKALKAIDDACNNIDNEAGGIEEACDEVVALEKDAEDDGASDG